MIRSARAFTLIELLVVITIISVLALGAYVPYSLYGNISRVRASADMVSQAVDEARVSAVSGYLYGASGHNANVGILIEENSPVLTLLAYPNTLPLDQIAFTGGTNAVVVKTYPLEPDVSVETLSGATSDIMNAHKVLVFFRTPRGEMTFLVPAGSGAAESSGASIDFNVGYQNAISGVLVRDVSIKK